MQAVAIALPVFVLMLFESGKVNKINLLPISSAPLW
jgi:hypothetical protein